MRQHRVVVSDKAWALEAVPHRRWPPKRSPCSPRTRPPPDIQTGDIVSAHYGAADADTARYIIQRIIPTDPDRLAVITVPAETV